VPRGGPVRAYAARMEPRLLFYTLTAALLGGCGSKPASESNTATPIPAQPNTIAPAGQPNNGAQPTSTAAFDVHEWGVIDVAPSGAVELAAGPGTQQNTGARPAPPNEEPRPMRKPVVYFHLDPGAAALDVDVRAHIPRGSMLEVWPEGELAADAIRWPHVRVSPCGVPMPSIAAQLPRLRADRSATRDGYSEVFELPEYETSDAACLTSGTTTGRLLFYRGAVPSTPLPIEVSRSAQGARVMRASARGEGTVIFTAAGGRGITLPWPAVGADVGLPEAFSESFEGEQLARTLEREITERGLTGPEAAAFMRAWSRAFFGVDSPASGATRDQQEAGRESTRRGPRVGPPAALIYVMPEATVAGVAELTITPPPRSVRRVMVVRIELSAR